MHTWKNRLQRYFTKLSNDWVPNLAAMLAYNLIMSFFPIVIALVSILGFLLGSFGFRARLTSMIVGALPPTISHALQLQTVFQGLHQSAGILGIVSLVGMFWAGSGLFGSMENAFSIIYATKDRSLVRQKMMAFGMILLLVVAVPVILFATALPSLATGALGSVMPLSPVKTVLIGLGGVLGAVAAAFLLFYLIYLIVPNQHIDPRHAWPGAVLAAALITVISFVFPLYTSMFVHTQQYGAEAGLAIVVLLWCWFVSIILLLGAELNSMIKGYGPALADIPTSLRKLRDASGGEAAAFPVVPATPSSSGDKHRRTPRFTLPFGHHS